MRIPAMHAFRFLAVFLSAAAMLHGAEAPRRIAFSRDQELYVANLDGTGMKKIARGSWGNISPDGTRLAFTTEMDKTTERHIAIADVATGKVTVLTAVPSDNNYSPIWSPDGRKLIFNSMQGREWRLGIIDADGTHFRYFTPQKPLRNGLNSVAWTPDSRSFYAQDLATLYHFALDGSLLGKRSLAKLFPGGSLSSDLQFAVSRDGRTMLLEMKMDEPFTRTDWNDAPPAIWLFDLSTAKVKRLTAKDSFSWMPSWLSDHEFLCAVLPEKTSEPSLYRISIDGQQRELVLKNADNPSVSH